MQSPPTPLDAIPAGALGRVPIKQWSPNAPPSPNESVLTTNGLGVPTTRTVAPPAAPPDPQDLRVLARQCKLSLGVLGVLSVGSFVLCFWTSSSLAGLPLLAISLVTTLKGLPEITKVIKGEEQSGSELMFMCLICLSAAVMTSFLWTVFLVTILYAQELSALLVALLANLFCTSVSYFYW